MCKAEGYPLTEVDQYVHTRTCLNGGVHTWEELTREERREERREREVAVVFSDGKQLYRVAKGVNVQFSSPSVCEILL